MGSPRGRDLPVSDQRSSSSGSLQGRSLRSPLRLLLRRSRPLRTCRREAPRSRRAWWSLAGRLANDPRLRGLSAQKRQERVAFVVGNLLFVLGHELGHAVIAEFDLPVLGREEDTADVYAISKALTIVNNELSHRALMRASTAWFMSARRARRDGEAPAYHEQHGLDQQRAYHIICLMVGSDPDKFKALADEHRLPEDRRRSCMRDYHVATRSWQRVMGEHARCRPAQGPGQRDLRRGARIAGRRRPVAA